MIRNLFKPLSTRQSLWVAGSVFVAVFAAYYLW
jgi:hypothetical protein